MRDEAADHQDALAHAWAWFKLHANQRMSMIKFSILTVGGVAAGISTLTEEHQYFPSAAICGFGAVLCFCLIRLDKRTSDLVKLGEHALTTEQNRLALLVDNPNLRLCQIDDEATKIRLSTYSDIFKLLFAAAALIFIAFGLMDCYVSHYFNLL